MERICFQVEEAQWFYEDFVRPLDPALPSLSLKAFAMRIFQHCPLMSEWSEYHHAAAFSEFLAYKTRVPVRGAILLNESMDKVVLVKGWKKNANWSFPRGKINKEEKDLDCAVREVFEETGYDLKAAGLVKDEKHMKYIEITMREQHMKLYVFRGVPMDTAFAPQTRKEISKIEWVNLSDLPTVKKNKQTQHDAANANKFYMVAPFLNLLKKWISQQRKLDAKNNAIATALAYTEGETSMDEGFVSANNGFTPMQTHLQPIIPSDLPEVNPTQDVSSHLKRILNIGTPITSSIDTTTTDSSKSNALLSLLRAGANETPTSGPSLPQQHVQPPALYDQMVNNGDQPPYHQRTLPVPQNIPNPVNNTNPLSHLQNQQHFNQLLSSIARPSQSDTTHVSGYNQRLPMESTPHAQRDQMSNVPPQPVLAPYQRTGDPLSAQQTIPGQSQGQVVPPASKLPPPKLTSHSLALLNVFKGSSPSQSHPGVVSQVEGQQPAHKAQAPQDQLLALLKSPANSVPPMPAVELAAQPVQTATKQILQRPASLNKPTALPEKANTERNKQDVMASATVSGPLRTPDFANAGHQTRKGNATPRMIGKQTPPTSSPITILSRPPSARRDLSTSSGHPSGPASPSLESRTRNTGTGKNFQPHILRRSEKMDLNTILPSRTLPVHELSQDSIDVPALNKAAVASNEKVVQTTYDRRPSQTAAQKETLLSLFGKSPGKKEPLLASAMSQSISGGAYSDAAISSPSLSGVETAFPPAISNAGSLSDNSSQQAQRIKSPDNKAFLLGFLQNVAEGKR